MFFSLSASNRVYGQLIVRLHDTTRGDALQNMINSYSQYSLTETRILSSRFNIRLFNFDHTLIDCEDMLDLLNDDPYVDFAEFDVYVASGRRFH